MNLWADFDDKPDFQFAHMRQARTRRLSEQAVLAAVRDWLLRDYAAAYCRSLAATRIFRRCYWIDALGANQNAAPAIESSQAAASLIKDASADRAGKARANDAKRLIHPVLLPVHALSQILAGESRSITLHGFILEAGSGKRRVVKTEQNGAPLAPKAIVMPKDGGVVRAGWLEVAPELLATIDQSAAIFLLHPFSKALFRYEDLAPLYTRTAPTELFLLVSHKRVEASLIPGLRTPTGAAAFTGLVRNDRWKALLRDDVEGESTTTGLVEALMSSMQQHFLTVQRVALPMLVKPAQVEPAPYTLIFATRRQDSLAAMNDAICVYRRRLD